MSSSLQHPHEFAAKHPGDAAVLATLGKNIPGEHSKEATRSLGTVTNIPNVNGPSQQEKLCDRAKLNHKFEVEQRRTEAAHRLHPDQIGERISDQHSDEANVDGIRNIN